MITEGFLARHATAQRGMKGPALLDVVQDYALQYLHAQGLFELGVVLKGGTSLRKYRAGNAGRFSTDLDFAAPDADTGEFLLDTLDGAEVHGVRLQVTQRSALRGRLDIVTPLGSPDVPARVEVSPRPLWLPIESRPPVSLPVHRGYEFSPAAMPVPALSEAVAEKLAAWRRRRKMRDLYDLYWFGQGVLDEQLVRRLLVLKVWHDVVDDGLGAAPYDPEAIVEDVDVALLLNEAIGLLTQPVQPTRWLAALRSRYQFVVHLDDVERRIARCNPGDRYQVAQLVGALAEG